MHTYIITDRLTGEQTEVVAPNRDAALKAHVSRRLTVARVPAAAAAPETPETPAADQLPDVPCCPPITPRSRFG
jgi:hypothetical protein